MTTLAPPPQTRAVEPARRRGAARRAIRRWAWRMLRREWRQQLIVLILLVAAVAMTTVGLGLVVNIQSGDQSVFGSADARVDVGGPGAAGIARDIAAVRQRFGTVEAIVHETVPVPGSITPIDVRAQDQHGVFGQPMLRLVSGRYPTGAGEVAVTAAVAQILNLKVGGTWTVDRRPVRVVGIIENPENLQDAFGLVAPGTITHPTGLTLLFNADPNALASFHLRAGSVQSIESSGDTSAQRQRNQALAVLLLATIGLIFVGLLSVAGFTVMAQRRLRALGMIGAIGATDRHIRRVMLANGTGVGIVGAGFGVVLGLGVWLALTPAFENVVGHRYDPFSLPWWAVVAAGVLAVVTSIAASWWPARGVAKIPIVAALSGRPAPPQPAHRFALLGTVLAAGGFVCLVLAHSQRTALIIGGIVATTAGMLLLAPLGIRALASLAGHAPVAVRLALRDLVRYQARSGAALAAASLAVGIAATIAVTAAAQQSNDKSLAAGNLPNNQLIVWLSNPNAQAGPVIAVPTSGASGAPAVPPARFVTAARGVARAIAHDLGSSTVVQLDGAYDLNTPIPAGAPPGAAQVSLVHPITENGHSGFSLISVPLVAEPAVLDLYGIKPADISAGADIVTSHSGRGNVELGSGIGRTFTSVTVQRSSKLPAYSSAPNTLITAAGMRAGRFTAAPVGWLIQTPGALTTAQIKNARNLAAASGVTTETRTAPDQSLNTLRDDATITGLLVALGVLAMTIGLIRSETTQDLRTLTAAGAGARTRRALHATSAGALGLLAGVLGTAGAYLAQIAWHWHDTGYLGQPPYANLAALVFGLPVVAAAGAWLLSRTPGAIARRPLE